MSWLERCLFEYFDVSRYAVLGVNHTTRPKNTVEVDHEAYHFVSIDTFRDMLKQGEFLTIFEVLGHCYGFGTYNYKGFKPHLQITCF